MIIEAPSNKSKAFTVMKIYRLFQAHDKNRKYDKKGRKKIEAGSI